MLNKWTTRYRGDFPSRIEGCTVEHLYKSHGFLIKTPEGNIYATKGVIDIRQDYHNDELRRAFCRLAGIPWKEFVAERRRFKKEEGERDTKRKVKHLRQMAEQLGYTVEPKK